MNKVPFLSFHSMNDRIRKEVTEDFASFFDSCHYIMGERLQRFETEYARFNETQYCVGVGNGLDAIRLSLLACGVGPGDEVIIPGHTFIATALAVSQVGATPILVDVRSNTLNLNPDLVRAAITPRTKALIPVHLYGQACEMDSLLALANEFGLHVIEDNAQSHGARFNNQLTGSFGVANATSFYPGKNLGAFGDGGAITTNSDELADKLRRLRNYGSKIKYQHELQGLNSRLDEVQAGFLSIKLRHLREWTEDRVRLATRYGELLRNLDGLTIPEVAKGATHVYHLYVVLSSRRDELQKFLQSRGVETLAHYPVPVHLQPAYRSMSVEDVDLSVTERVAKQCLSLPLYPGLSQEDQDRVIAGVREFHS